MVTEWQGDCTTLRAELPPGVCEFKYGTLDCINMTCQTLPRQPPHSPNLRDRIPNENTMNRFSTSYNREQYGFAAWNFTDI